MPSAREQLVESQWRWQEHIRAIIISELGQNHSPQRFPWSQSKHMLSKNLELLYSWKLGVEHSIRMVHDEVQWWSLWGKSLKIIRFSPVGKCDRAFQHATHWKYTFEFRYTWKTCSIEDMRKTWYSSDFQNVSTVLIHNNDLK